METEKMRYLEACLGENFKFSVLKDIIAETSSLFQIQIFAGTIKSKLTALKWISDNWEQSKQVLNNFLEMRCSLNK